MKRIDFCEALGNADENYVEAAHGPKTGRRPRWLKWGAAAACLCLVISAAVLWNGGLDGGTNAGGGASPGGSWPEGVDPVAASVAVLPAGESLLDMADATVTTLTEEEARAVEGLGDWLPGTLPEDCRYNTAFHYETTMKDGTRYHMLRVSYERGESSAPGTVTDEEGEVIASSINENAFLWMVYGHRPDTKRPVYQPEEITAQLLERQAGVFYLDCGEAFVGISRYDIRVEELLEVIRSAGCPVG